MSRLEIPQSLDAWVVTYYFPDTPVQSLNITGAPNRILMERPPRLIFTVFSDAKASTSPRDGKSPIPPRYDGAKSSFGDIGVSATVANLDQLSTFAAQRSTDEALTVMVINKVLSGTTPVTIALNKFEGTGKAHVYQLTSANVIQQLADLTYSRSTLNLSAPAQSITLLVIPKGADTLRHRR